MAEFQVPARTEMRFQLAIGIGTRLSQRLTLILTPSMSDAIPLSWTSDEKFAPNGGSWRYRVPAFQAPYDVTVVAECKRNGWHRSATDDAHKTVTKQGGSIAFDDIGDKKRDWNFQDLIFSWTFGSILPVSDTVEALSVLEER